ncbi:MAG: dTDP-4-dehydrorhamnose reductase [Lachnospiraceae bacterium]|nr:dTDP-4-dehydrorhamnose reductase [Lachnospiraceae bacterium]
MKILVTGVKGQLGFDVVHVLKENAHVVIGVDVEEMDITKADVVRDFITKVKPDAVIHCAAYTAVDAAEDNPALCMAVNAVGTESIAKVCKELDIKMMYISTDYVFPGEGESPWKPEDVRQPLNVYGKSKYQGELAIEKYLSKYFIVRIAWVFGVNGNNFVKTMLKLSRDRDVISVVDDQIGSPTYTADLAVLLAEMIETDKYGKYHATNEGLCTWYEFAKEIFRQAQIDMQVNPVTSDKFPVKAKRPHNSRLDKCKLVEQGFQPLPTWQDALGRYLRTIQEQEDGYA